MLYLDLFCASVSKMCPKVIDSSLYTISAYESLHRNALFLNCGKTFTPLPIWSIISEVLYLEIYFLGLFIFIKNFLQINMTKANDVIEDVQRS